MASRLPGAVALASRAALRLDKPIVCALERYAINAGSALALAADSSSSAMGAFLQVGEVIQGRPAPMNLAWLRLRYGDAFAAVGAVQRIE